MLLIKNGKIFTMEGHVIERGDILIKDGRINRVAHCIAESSQYEVINAEGKLVFPGFIESHCHIGMEEPYSAPAGDDINESTDPITPYLNAIDGMNPFDPSFKDALKAGITTVCTGPGSANVIGGTFAVVKTWSSNIDSMVIKDKAAMKAALGENPKRVYGNRGKMPSTRMGISYLLRDTLIKTKNYINKKNKSLKDNDIFDIDIKYESMTPVINGEMPLKIHVHRADDIIAALRIAKEFNINITLDHCSDGLMLMDEIKKSKVPAIVGPTMTFKRKVETRGKTFITAGEFSKNGILTAITTDHPVICIEYLPICAGLCVREGMDFIDALRAITINPAKILDIDDKLGSIKEGKDADIVIYNGSPFDTTNKSHMVIVNGNIAYRR